MSLKKHINFLIETAKLAEIEDKELKKKYGVGDNGNIDENRIKLAFAERKEEDKLEKYLSKLDDELLLKLQTIMYFGRNDNLSSLEDLNSQYSYFKDMNDEKEEIIRTIIEKRLAYEQYFTKAIHKLDKLDHDIEIINNLEKI